MKNFPRQRLSYKDKIKEDNKWAKEVIDALVFSTGGSVVNNKADYDEMLSNYQLFNNILNQKDFERECNPLGLEVGQFKDEIKPYNKTYNKIQVLMGEELRRAFNFRPVLVNSEGIRSKSLERDSMLRNYIYQSIQQTIQKVNELYLPELVETNTILDPSEIEKYFKTTYQEAREILASQLLNYLNKKLNIKDLRNDAFKHGLISAREFVYVGIENEEPSITVLNPLNVFYYKSGEDKYLHESLYAGHKTYLTAGQVLDLYSEFMTKEDIELVETKGFTGAFSHTPTKDMQYHHEDWEYLNEYPEFTEGSYSSANTNDWLVQTVEWRSEKKVGFLKFINEYGDIEETMVSEDFEIPDSHTKKVVTKEFGKKCTYYYWSDGTNQYVLEWKWIPEVWTGTKIGHSIYVKIGPKETQFRSSDNPYEVRLGYHGLIYSAMNATPISPMSRMKPFQYLYFIIMHKLKKLIAFDQGRIFHFDVSMVDPEMGLDKTMYYLRELNIDFFNPLQNADKPGWSQRGKVSSSTDMSQSQNIMNYINLLASIDQQISDVAGVNRQREGQITPGEAVSNAQSNVQMSSVITEIYFHSHNKLWEQILTSLLKVAQDAYKGKNLVKQYVLDDLTTAVLEMSPDELSDCDFGLFVSDSIKEEELFQNMKSLAQALIQNDKASFTDLIKMYKSSSIEDLERDITQAEEDRNKQIQSQQQAQFESQAQLQAQQQEFQFEFQAREHENKVLLAEIDSFKFQMDQDKNNNDVPDQLEVRKFEEELKIKKKKLELEEKKINKMGDKPKQ